MSPFSVTSRGDFRNIEAFGNRIKQRTYLRALSRFGPQGVSALQNATPRDTGETATDWTYQVVDKPGRYSIHWFNHNRDDDGKVPVAVLIQYGHGTRNGGFVEGVDFINPALKPIFQAMADEMWKEVTK